MDGGERMVVGGGGGGPQEEATLWTVARPAPLSMGFSRQEYWMGCHFLLQGIFQSRDLLLWQVDSLPLSHQETPHVLHAAI